MTLFSSVFHPVGTTSSNLTAHQASATRNQVVLTQTQLLTMAGNPYANGIVPLGDKKYVTDNPKQGYIYLCNVPPGDGGGSQHAGSWISSTTWNFLEKPHVSGNVSWPTAQFSDNITGDSRVLSGNGLPVRTTTGTFPISSTDQAYQYDRNPNSIQTQSINLTLPVNPTYSAAPYCMGMEVGVMTNGVPLFNGFDADLRDAAAHEVQDSCDGHPQSGGEYHYHSLSSCLTSIDETTVIGYALDGFPITGPKVAADKYLTTANLDECHGITSTIILDGRQVAMYHYVMTQDFPYSVSCFRGKPVSLQVMQSSRQAGAPSGQEVGQHNNQLPEPPQAAFNACSGKTTGDSCSFTAPRGTVNGTCQTRPGQTNVVCAPSVQGQGAPLSQ